MPELTRRQQLIGGASLVVLVATFLPWETFHFPEGPSHLDGWTTGLVGWGGSLLLAVAGEYLIVRRLEYRIWAPPFGDSRLAAGLAVIGLALVIVRFVTLPTFASVGTSVGYGLWIALAAGIVQTVAILAEARDAGSTPSS